MKFKLKNGSYNDIIIDVTKNLTTIQLIDKCSINDTCIRYFLGLALGMIPQVNRGERDIYVHVNYSNINSTDVPRFNNLSSLLFKEEQYDFDYGSFFNINPYYFSNNTEKTYTSRNSSLYDRMLGQKIDYSFGDRRTLCNYYNIKTVPKLTCQNGGFYNPNTSECICPDGYITNDCSKLQEMKNCGNHTHNATEEKGYIFACGNKTCYYEITSLNNKSIEIEFLSVNTKNVTPCVPHHGLELRYGVDKGTTGLSLCGLYNETISLASFSSKVFIGYNGGPNDYFLMSYKINNTNEQNEIQNTNRIRITKYDDEIKDINFDCQALFEAGLLSNSNSQ
uniref:Astacin domain-containing protein n=1 Tax=Parastrongyloides trichosuri TaxID=131310 RepID=A0A0N4ZGS2_PARTI